MGAVWSVAPQLIATYRLSPNWMAGMVLSAEVFSDAVRNSPLVQKKSRYDALIGLGCVWR